MKLADIFTGRAKNEDIGRLQKMPVSSNAASVNRQIRSMVPGQTIQGEIVSRNGGEVQIRMADDMVLNARVDQNLNIEVGKNMTFEVKNNGSALTLSPLFTNVSTDMNVLKALDMAGISVNPTSVAMTEQMMKAGLPIDRNSIQQLYREVNAFPDAEISDIVNLHKLGLSVNRENVEQMAAYRELNHQLIQGMETVMDALPDVLEELTAKGDMAGAAKLYQELLHMAGESNLALDAAIPEAVTDGTENGAADAQDVNAQNTMEETIPPQADQGTVDGGLAEALETAVKLSADAGEIELAENIGVQSKDSAQAQEISQELRGAVSRELGQALSLLDLSPQEREQLAQQIRQFAEGGSDSGQLFHTVEQMLESAGRQAGGKEAMRLLMSGKGVSTLLADTLKDSWSLRPQDVAEPDKVENLYKRLDRQLKGLAQTLETVGQSGSEAYKAASAMSQNIDFLQQLNQMYTYVQLPLRLQQGNAHGDLYVYTNKKNLAARDGAVSALLHLDMEHLGPVDVYVAMQNSKVSTRFYVADDEMLDLLEAHMDLLTERLQKRGYDCSMSMEIRGEKEAKSGLEPILEQEKGVALSQYAFDVRT
ncbi:MAG: flagellar hook-length control protein FliK [Lachnospiraceae bacterium]|nr:flagellar hook-length control protein FliK [Butyrivibrio sp.]MCM1345234.1 flagellar hook-length control protein FliK [Muribaculaceae bacterium]MCM1410513.1 flagellar hook-length control protein FliK [Lachnospiraceae bacterium]